MNLPTHDPREHIRGIHQILISDKKRIGFLFGAGSSFATGISTIYVPVIAEMTNDVLAGIASDSPKFATAVSAIKKEIGEAQFNIESLLSSIEAKRAVIGNGTLNGLTGSEFSALAACVKEHVVRIVSVHGKLLPEDIAKLAHSKLSSWVSKARRRFPAEIFTTNYDYLFEIALESSGIPYFDGFSGSFEPFFCPEAVEDVEAYSHLVKLWKMHGSLGWIYRERDKAVVRKPSAPAESILIYPSHLKYNTSKKQPYVGLIDRLCTFLQQDDAVLIICGYSFGDNHINERIATSLRRGVTLMSLRCITISIKIRKRRTSICLRMLTTKFVAWPHTKLVGKCPCTAYAMRSSAESLVSGDSEMSQKWMNQFGLVNILMKMLPPHRKKQETIKGTKSGKEQAAFSSQTFVSSRSFLTTYLRPK